MARPGFPLLVLLDLRRVTATFYLPNAELGAARAGAPVEVTADAWPDRRFTGTVAQVGLAAEFTPRNVQTREDRDRLVYPVEVTLENPDGALRPGMPVEVALLGTGGRK
ncbi:MAG: efflux RND transporter periplasmic adaptor subunit [bacterium]